MNNLLRLWTSKCDLLSITFLKGNLEKSNSSVFLDAVPMENVNYFLIVTIVTRLLSVIVRVS